MRARIPLLLAVAVLSGCYLNELNHLQAPTLQVQQVEVRDFSLASVDLVATVDVQNPNPFVVSLLPSTATVTVNGAKVLDTTLPTNLDLPPEGHAVTKLGMRVPWSAVTELATLMARQEEEAPCTVDTVAHFRTPVGELDIPLEFHTKLPLPQFPRLRFDGLHVSQLSFTNAQVEVQLGIDNPNAQPLALEAIDARLMNGERVIAHVASANSPILVPNAVTQVSIAVPMSFLADGPAILDSLQSHGVDLRVVGTVRISGRDLPIDAKIGP